MPTISAFYGILIRMFFNDHPPRHFHARYEEFEAKIDLDTMQLMEGTLPKRALNLVLECIEGSCLTIGGFAARTCNPRKLSRCREMEFDRCTGMWLK
jgi:Domain of unknown function (DUF4160)